MLLLHGYQLYSMLVVVKMVPVIQVAILLQLQVESNGTLMNPEGGRQSKVGHGFCLPDVGVWGGEVPENRISHLYEYMGKLFLHPITAGQCVCSRKCLYSIDSFTNRN